MSLGGLEGGLERVHTHTSPNIYTHTHIYVYNTLICKKSRTLKETALPWTGESSSIVPSYDTLVLTANATGLVCSDPTRNKKGKQRQFQSIKHDARHIPKQKENVPHSKKKKEKTIETIADNNRRRRRRVCKGEDENKTKRRKQKSPTFIRMRLMDPDGRNKRGANHIRRSRRREKMK